MRLIDFLIRLYPEEFRARFGRQLRDFHTDLENDGRASLAPVVSDHVTSAMALRMQTFAQDMRYALRSLARRPAFATVVLATIALGVGANAAIFSVVNGILFRPLPYPNPEQLVFFGHKPPHWLTDQRSYFDYKRDVASFASLSAYVSNEGTLTTDGEPERVGVVSATRDFLSTIKVAPAVGRDFAVDEDLARPATVAIISHSLWQRRFGGDPRVVGSRIRLNGIPRSVVGVMPPHFDYPSNRTDVWLPMPRFNMDSLEERGNYALWVVGRLKSGRTVAQATQEANTVARRMAQDNPYSFDPRNPLQPVIEPVRERLLGQTTPYLWALLGAVGFVLLIVCVNVANLLLARGEGRRKEMAVRTALGASRSRIAMQLLTECVVLAIAGGVTGLGLAWALQRALVAAAPASIPRLDEIGVDWTMVAYTFAIALIAGLFFGLAPALRGAREAPAATLKEGGKTMSHGGSQRIRRALVVAEIALAVVMLSGASMLLRSLLNLQSAGMGFDASSVFTARVTLTNQYPEERTAVFYDELLRRIRAIPGVQSAGAARWLPVVDAGGLWGVIAEGKSYGPSQAPSLVPQQVMPGFFDAIGLPIVAGRALSESDRAGGPYAAVISRKAAKLLWPEVQDALGQRFRIGLQLEMMTVVGIVDDIRMRGYQDTPEPTMYIPYPQTPKSAYFLPRQMSLVVRTSGDPMRIANQVRAAVRALDPGVPVSEVRTLEQVVGTSVANRRFSTGLIAAIAALALMLAGIGIFGVISYGVSERTFEIGVRMALGAERSRVMTLIVGDGVRMALIGLAVGLLGAYGMARAIKSMLVDVPSVDPPTLALVSVALTLVAIGASIIPARRAMSVSPTEALRGS